MMRTLMVAGRGVDDAVDIDVHVGIKVDIDVDVKFTGISSLS